ncbi:MAG: HRDC domain-containing protein [Candidatus Schekmanbacteria bacterium]|nr:HRDC domain-containing protein [Candidatus Schekmanbacteria bacterium]
MSTPREVAALCGRIAADRGAWGLDVELTLTGVHDCRLALVQVSDGIKAWLVDSLQVDPTQVFSALFANAEPVVLHDGRNDLIVVKRLCGVIPEVFFDTMIAATLIGEATPNLRDLAERYLDNLHMGKQLASSNWCRRPLARSQACYAALDAFVLPALRGRLLPVLRERQLETVLDEAQQRALQAVHHYVRPARNAFERRFAKRCHDHEAQMRLQRLLAWRTALGNEGNLEVIMGFGNRALADLARRSPQSCESLLRDHDISPELVRRYGERLLAIVRGDSVTSDAAPVSSGS